MTVGERLVALRQAHEMTQAEVADAVGVNLKTIRRYEQDKHSPNVEAIAAIARLYGVTADDIVFGFSEATQSKVQQYRRIRVRSHCCRMYLPRMSIADRVYVFISSLLGRFR